MKYRKKPVVIEAVQWTGDNVEELLEFLGGVIVMDDKSPILTTLEGRMNTSIGDWVIKGVAGEFYPCKPDIFEKTYEPVEEV